MMQPYLRQCTVQDFETLRLLSIRTYFETFAPYNTKENMDAYLKKAFQKEKLYSELAEPHSSFYFLYDRGNLAGYIKVNEAPAQTDLNDSASLELERIYVDRPFQGKGLGMCLMRKALSLAAQAGKTFLWLGVWEKNEKALRFYKKNGFYRFSTHPFRMGDDVQRDDLLRKDL